MSALRERESYDYKLGVREFSLSGVVSAIGESPIINNFPPVLKIGTVGMDGTVTLKDGKIAQIDENEVFLSLGKKVVVFEKAHTFFSLEPQE